MGIDELERAADLLMGRTIAAFVTRVEDDGREVFVVICDDGTTLTCEHPIVDSGEPPIVKSKLHTSGRFKGCPR